MRLAFGRHGVAGRRPASCAVERTLSSTITPGPTSSFLGNEFGSLIRRLSTCSNRDATRREPMNCRWGHGAQMARELTGAKVEPPNGWYICARRSGDDSGTRVESVHASAPVCRSERVAHITHFPSISLRAPHGFEPCKAARQRLELATEADRIFGSYVSRAMCETSVGTRAISIAPISLLLRLRRRQRRAILAGDVLDAAITDFEESKDYDLLRLLQEASPPCVREIVSNDFVVRLVGMLAL
jgi:hypothetical protein